MLLLVPAMFKYSPGRSASNQISGINALFVPLLAVDKKGLSPGLVLEKSRD